MFCIPHRSIKFAKIIKKNFSWGHSSRPASISTKQLLCPAKTVISLGYRYTLQGNISCIMKKPAFCICKTKGTDQLHGNSTAHQHLCFCYIDSTIPPLPKSEISSLLPSSVAVQPCVRWIWLETKKTGFLFTRLICCIPCKLYTDLSTHPLLFLCCIPTFYIHRLF